MRERVRIDALSIDFDGVLRHWPASDADAEMALGIASHLFSGYESMRDFLRRAGVIEAA